MSEGLLAVLLGAELETAVQFRWARRLAAARGFDILVYERDPRAEGLPVEVDLRAPSGKDDSQTAEELRRLIDQSPDLAAGPAPKEESRSDGGSEEGLSRVRFRRLASPSPRKFRDQLIRDIQEEKVLLITSADGHLNTTEPEIVRERRLFLRFVPCEVVFCFGLQANNDLTRVVVGTATGPHGRSAVRLAADLAKQNEDGFTALRINPEIGPDASRVGARRLDDLLRRYLGKESDTIRRRVLVDDQVESGIRRALETQPADLLLLGASRVGLFGSHIAGGVGAHLSRGDDGPAIAIVSSGSPLRNRFLGLVEGTIERLVPQIEREDRVALVDRIQSSSQWDFDFCALMVLSTLIAAIGLIQNSAAVVIGAMLVAPLMTPLLGLGLALVQGNPVLARTSIRSIGFGVIVSLLVGTLVGLVTPGFVEPSREMIGRGGPGMLDLFVAFASGLAAAYASSRPGLLAALPGVAIAAALVPPIATSGLGLSLGNFDLAFNSFLLFVINMFTIVLASMTSLWAVGLRSIKKAARWRLVVVNAIPLAVLALGIFLSTRPIIESHDNQIPAGLVTRIEKQLGSQFNLDSLGLAYDEMGLQLNLMVVGDHAVPPSVANGIRAIVRSSFEKPVRVRLVSRIPRGASGLE